MRFTALRFALPVLLTATASVAAGAQQMQCDVNEGSPSQVSRAYVALTVAQQAQAGESFTDAARQLQSAARQLSENPERINNALGRSMVLGKVLTLWLNQPGIGFTATRGAIGLVGAPEQQIDLIATIDSLFDEVETAQPGCASALAPWRAQKPWLNLVNSAIELFNNDQIDSAAVVATRADRLFSDAPYALMVLGNVASRRGQVTQAAEYYKKSIATTEGDTSYADARRSILLALGTMAMEASDTAKAPLKGELQATAIAAFEQLVKEFPDTPQGTNARMGLSTLRLAQGDTAALKAAYQDQLTNPANYSYQSLLMAAVGAARADQHADAAKLFEHVLTQNPFNRDALFNLAIMYNNMSEFQKMIPVIGRLVAVDPNNVENWQLYSFAYNGISKASKVAAAKRAANDSTVKYYEMGQKMTTNVIFTEWTNSPERTTVAGTVENRGAAPRAIALTFEFLDKAGNVVATETVTTDQLAPKTTGRFSVSSAAPGIIAFRYQPIK